MNFPIIQIKSISLTIWVGQPQPIDCIKRNDCNAGDFTDCIQYRTCCVGHSNPSDCNRTHPHAAEASPAPVANFPPVALPPAVKNSAAVLRVEALSLEDFLNDFMRPGVPVVIEGAMEVCADNVTSWRNDHRSHGGISVHKFVMNFESKLYDCH
jgi:hypothetical protein